MIYFLKYLPKRFRCNCSSICWCSESNLSHHYDGICQRFAKVFLWWVIIHHRRSKLNRPASMVIGRYQYQPLTKAMFSSPVICGNIFTIFGMGLKPPKFLHKINWYTWIFIVLLEIVVYGRIFLVLMISRIGVTEDKARGMRCILNRGDSIYQYGYIYEIK